LKSWGHDVRKVKFTFFTELERNILKFVWKHKRPRIARAILRKKNGAGGNRLPDFRLYYKAPVIKTTWYWHKDRNIDRWNRTQSPEFNPRTYSQLIYDKGGKNIQWRKDRSFNKWCWENWTATRKRMKSEPFLTPYTKINSKTDERPRYKTTYCKTLRGKHRPSTLQHKPHSNVFSDPPPTVMTVKMKINKRDLIQLKSFCTAEETLNKTKRQPTEWERTFANEATDKGFISKIYKHFLRLNTKKNQATPSKKWAEDLNRQFSTEDTQMAEKHHHS